MLRNLVKYLILLASVVLASCQEDMIVSVDPAVTISPIKPMNAANNGPVKANMESYTALHIPYARTHDAALTEVYVAKHCVDISAVFPDWNAPVDDPASYDFVNTDVLIANMLKSGAKPFYRLGQSIEHGAKKYGIYPPKDYKKWARICEHIIRHYNEGWADGFHYDIEYWEIWNEPDLDVKEGRQVKTDVSEPGVYVCAASDGEKVRVLLANYNDDKGLCTPRKVTVLVPVTAGRCSCRITDDTSLDASESLAIRGGKARLTLPAYSVALLEY